MRLISGPTFEPLCKSPLEIMNAQTVPSPIALNCKPCMSPFGAFVSACDTYVPSGYLPSVRLYTDALAIYSPANFSPESYTIPASLSGGWQLKFTVKPDPDNPSTWLEIEIDVGTNNVGCLEWGIRNATYALAGSSGYPSDGLHAPSFAIYKQPIYSFFGGPFLGTSTTIISW